MNTFLTRYQTVILVTCMVLAVSILALATARSEEAASKPTPYPCPAAQPCKIVTMTADEEKAMGVLFDTALWANRTLTDMVTAWRQKLATAPAGAVPPAKP